MDTMLVFDRTAVRRHRDRAAATIASVEDLLRDGAERLLDRVDDMTGSFGRALDIGGRGVVAPLLRERGISVVSTDLSLPMARLNILPVPWRTRIPAVCRRGFVRSGGGEHVVCIGLTICQAR